MNKKGAEMTIGTIVFIILALVVLVVVIYGFSTGWGNLWDKITGYGGGKVNVQTHVSACELACSSGLTYDYCSKKRSVVFEEEQKAESVTCEDLAKKVPSVGLDECGSIACVQPTYECLSNELKEKACAGEIDTCEVQWMNTGNYNERKANSVGADKEWLKIDPLTEIVTEEDKANNQGNTCVKAIKNSNYVAP